MITNFENEREELHQLMEQRLENILKSMTETKYKRKVPRKFPHEPANQEKAEWNLGEIPILFGA